ncbi:MAG: helix-turn-helix domain-containing protein [Coprobacter sp.]|nr:helix-turn-helix domain-containing protein [Coprobacter sp.]
MKKILIWILCMAICSSYCHAYTFRNVSISDGLADLLVNTIYKDSTGLIWLGLGNSLDCFDGSHVKHYPVLGTNEVQKRVNAITELSGGRILMGNGSGLWHINKQTDKLERLAQEIIDCGVKCFLHHNDALFIGTENGVFIYKGSQIEHLLIHTNELDPTNHITDLYIHNDILWLSSENGIHSISLTTRKTNSYFYDGQAIRFTRITGIGNTLYIGTPTIGLVQFDIPTAQFSRYLNVECNVISALSSDGKDLLYVGTDGNGVHFISTRENKIIQSFRHSADNESALTSNAVYSLLVDRDNLIWIGYYQEGFDYTLYQNNTFTTYPATKGMKVRAAAIHGDEKLIGTREGLLFTNDATGEKRFFDKSQLNAQMVFSILHHQNRYYIGTYGGGMYTFDARKSKLSPFMPEDTELAKGQIYCIQPDATGALWIGTNIGLYRYYDKKLTRYDESNSHLPTGTVYEIFFDSKGKGWICTETGMCIWDSTAQRLRTDIFPDEFFHREKIRSIYEDNSHHLYFIPDKGAISVSDLSLRNFRRYLSPNSPLVDKDGQCIIEDEQGRLWIGTNNGIYRYESDGTYTSYNFSDGIPSPIFTLCKPIKDENGNIWFGNVKGLLQLKNNLSGHRNTAPYPIQITDLRIDGQPMGLSLPPTHTDRQEITLDKRPGSLTFCLSDLCYTAPEHSRFMVKLEGTDNDWKTITGETDITYYSPSWGRHKFIVMRPGDESSQTSISVYVPLAQNTKYSVFLSAIFICSFIIIYYIGKKIGIRIRKWKIVIESPSGDRKPVKESGEKYKATNIGIDEKEALLAKLTTVMSEQRLYIRPDLKLADLATAIGTSAQTLSYLFSQHLNSNYYDYINKFRIREFKHMVETDEYTRYTLTALAELCGFSSRASFFRYFKKETGLTPSEYISQEKEKK